MPRIQHPDWLHKKILEKNDVLKQRKISEMFGAAPKKAPTPKRSANDDNNEADSDLFNAGDIEDGPRKPLGLKNVAVVNKKKKRTTEEEVGNNNSDLSKSWREVLGNPPSRTKVREWIVFQKRKWAWQRKQKDAAQAAADKGSGDAGVGLVRSGNRATLGGFLRRAQRTLLDTPWQVVQVVELPGQPGTFRLWAMVGADLHMVKLVVPRIFYVNQRSAKDGGASSGGLWRKVQKTLPRSHPALNLYEYRVPEEVYRQHASDLVTDLSTPDIEGIYETQIPLDFRALVDLGCLCSVDKKVARGLKAGEADTFELGWLQFKTLANYHYLPRGSYKTVYLYQHRGGGAKSLFALFVPATRRAHVFVVDTVRSNQMPNLNNVYNSERAAFVDRDAAEASQAEASSIPEADYAFEVRVETDLRQVKDSLFNIFS